MLVEYSGRSPGEGEGEPEVFKKGFRVSVALLTPRIVIPLH